MNERQILAALRARDPRGVAELYDSYAEGLYDYSWWLLRDHGTAREALHDTLLASGVLADALRGPERLRPWLYGLIRAECLRRSPATPRTVDDDHGLVDTTELRSLAWQATEAVPASESDALELHIRHGIETADLASICRIPVAEVQELLDQAREGVSRALRVEMLSRTGSADCPELGTLLEGREQQQRRQQNQQDQRSDGELDEVIDRHALGCHTCSGRIPRKVSITRLMGLLPAASPPADLRQRVIDAYTEPRLLEYRLLAARRLQPLGRDGFPRASRSRRRMAGGSGGTAAVATMGGLVAAGLCVVTGFAMLQPGPLPVEGRTAADRDGGLRYEEAGSRPRTTVTTSTGALSLADVPGGVRNSGVEVLPRPGGGPAGPAGLPRAGTGLPPTGDGSAPGGEKARPGRGVITHPTSGGVRSRSRNEPTAPGGTRTPGSPSPSPGELRVSASTVGLGDGRQGSVTLSADGGPVSWSSSSDAGCLSVSPVAGSMDGGKQVVVAILLDRGDSSCPESGSGTVSFAEGGPLVQVTWTSPSPSPSPSSPTPTPSSPGSSNPGSPGS